MREITLLGISGSLRQSSFNTALLHAWARLLPSHVRMQYAAVDAIPPFNPDLDHEHNCPRSVTAWKQAIASADGIVIASPEYAHAIPGALKNALDWIVGSGELVGKPVAAINASPTHLGAQKAHEQLTYLIELLSAELLKEASFTVAAVNKKMDEKGEVNDEGTRRALLLSRDALFARIL